MKKSAIIVAALVVAAVAVVLLTTGPRDVSSPSAPADAFSIRSTHVAAKGGGGTRGTGPAAPSPSAVAAAEAPAEQVADAEPPTEEDGLAAEIEKLVSAFDALIDKWMKPAAKEVSMADVEAFAAAFRRIPKDRQNECIHRALNLVPDENVMLLAGVLMDKSADEEIVETVFNDILNRDETVKKPILLQVFKDKSHPCWADTAWILDVTGELPKE